MLLLSKQQHADTLLAACYQAVLILATVREQLRVQLGKVPGYWNRHPVVAAEVSYFAFYTALLVTFAGSAEAGLVLPVRTERNEAGRHLPLVAAQDLLHCARKVIVAKLAKHAAEVVER